MYYIGIENHRQVCSIGLYPEEEKILNTLEFNVRIGCPSTDVDAIPDWDYSVVPQIISQVLASEQHHRLLEDVLKKILNEIRLKFRYTSLSVQIKKLYPPTNEYIQSSYIEWTENN